MTFGSIEDPVDLKERSTVATQCVKDLNLPMDAIVDKIDDKVNQAYGGWPDRLYLVGKDGKVAYAGGQGPFLFKPDELDDAIAKELKKIRSGSNAASAAKAAEVDKERGRR